MRRAFASFLSNKSGNTVGEFALLLPLVLAFLLGMIDVGRYFWEVNKAEKATQMAARYAAVTTMVPNKLGGDASNPWYNFANATTGLNPGDPVTSTAFPGVTCTGGANNAVTCTCGAGGITGTCAFTVTGDTTVFGNIVTRLKWIKKDIKSNNVKVEYLYSGIGFAGDPTGPNVSPLVRVSLTGMTFTPVTFVLFKKSWNPPLPSFAYTLPMEDGQGSASN